MPSFSQFGSIGSLYGPEGNSSNFAPAPNRFFDQGPYFPVGSAHVPFVGNATIYGTQAYARQLALGFNDSEVGSGGCQPTVRMRNNRGVSVDLQTPEAADVLDVALGDETWSEVSRQTSSTQVNGVTIERIDRVTFARPSGGRTTLVFDHPPIQSTSPED